MQTQILKTKAERKDFLENDFIERLIRIEQRVSAKFGKLINYKDTYCYQNLAPENKKRYECFLKLKKKKKFVFAASLVIPLFGVLLLSNSITGNVVKEGVGEGGFEMFYWVLASFFVGLFIGFGLFYLSKYLRNKKYASLFEPLEKIAKKDSNRANKSKDL